MNLKRFLIRFIVIFILVSIIISVVVAIQQGSIMDYQYQGFPLRYIEGGGMCPYGPCGSSFNPVNLIIDIVFYAVLSAGITFASFKIVKFVRRNPVDL